MKKMGLLLIFILSTVFISSGLSLTDWVIDDERVYINDSRVYISVSPHTLKDSGYVYINLTSKVYSGSIDMILGLEYPYLKPKNLDLYNPKNESELKSADLSVFFDNPDIYNVEYTYDSISQPFIYDGYISIANMVNTTEPIMEYYFEQANINTKVIYWHELVLVEWQNLAQKIDIRKENFNALDMNTWFLISANIESDTPYYLRLYIDVVPQLNSDDETHKYCLGFKPSDKTIKEAIEQDVFYLLDPWYSNNWLYRKSHVIEQADDASTNYQINFTVYYGSGSDSGGVVYLNEKCNEDFGDLRFTSSDGETLMDYYISDSLDSDYAVIWVEISEDLDADDVTIYLYYGNSEATSLSSGEDTFLQFAEDVYVVTYHDNNDIYLPSFRVIGYFIYTQSAVNAIFGLSDSSSSPPNMVIIHLYQPSNFDALRCRESGSTTESNEAHYVTEDEYHYMEITCTQTEAHGYVDGVELGDELGVYSNIPYTNMGLWIYINSGNTLYFFACKYVSPEPQHGSWSSEETLPFTVTFIIGVYGQLEINGTLYSGTKIIIVESGTVFYYLAYPNASYQFISYDVNNVIFYNNPSNLTVTEDTTINVNWDSLTGDMELTGGLAFVIIVMTLLFVITRKKR